MSPMKCVYCKGNIEYRSPSMFFENEEDRYLCTSCLNIMSVPNDDVDSFFVDYSEIDSIIYNNGRTPPRFIE